MRSISPASSPTSSERRKAPAKPTNNKARSRRPNNESGILFQDLLKIRNQNGRLAHGSDAQFPAEAGQEPFHRPGAGAGFKTGLLVQLADGGQAPRERVPLLVPVLGEMGAI